MKYFKGDTVEIIKDDRIVFSRRKPIKNRIGEQFKVDYERQYNSCMGQILFHDAEYPRGNRYVVRAEHCKLIHRPFKNHIKNLLSKLSI